MLITKIGRDLIEINEKTFSSGFSSLQSFKQLDKIHLIKLNLQNPTKSLIFEIFKIYPQTKRFIVEETLNCSINYWNSVFKQYKKETGNWKKFYVENSKNQSILKFLKRHNKILLNLGNLTESALNLVKFELNSILDLVEVIKGPIDFLKNYNEVIMNWTGNYIIEEKDFSNCLELKKKSTTSI